MESKLDQFDLKVVYFDEVANNEFGAFAQLYFAISEYVTFFHNCFGVAASFGNSERLE